jgi:hypothetical protein
MELVMAMKNSASDVLAQAIRFGRSGALPPFSPKTKGAKLSGAGMPGPTSAPGASEPPAADDAAAEDVALLVEDAADEAALVAAEEAAGAADDDDDDDEDDELDPQALSTRAPTARVITAVIPRRRREPALRRARRWRFSCIPTS